MSSKPPKGSSPRGSRRAGSAPAAEIATAIAFLLPDDASHITGAHLAVDGGFLA